MRAMNMRSANAIVAVVDPRARHQAGLAKAALLAQNLHARVDLFEIVRGAETSPLLKSLARPLRDRGLEVTTQAARDDSLSAALAEHLKHTCPKFVIKDVHQRTLAQPASLTGSDRELIRSCPVALLISKPLLWPERPRICMAIDPENGAQARASVDQIVMEQGALLAGQMGGELHVLHAYIPPAYVVTVPAVDDFRALEHSHELLIARCHAKLRSLKTLASSHGVSTDHVHMAIGPVCDALTCLASEQKASVIVMGALSRSASRRDAIGSSAEALLEQISCDVLVVKATDATNRQSA
jgi:universal stress protein E